MSPFNNNHKTHICPYHNGFKEKVIHRPILSWSSLLLPVVLVVALFNFNNHGVAASFVNVNVNTNIKSHASATTATACAGFKTCNPFLGFGKSSIASSTSISASSSSISKEEHKNENNDKNDTNNNPLLNYDGRISYYNDDVLRAQHRCGFVSLIGAPNMGKSTLLNSLLQESLCTATHRPQTTRHSILGVLSSSSDNFDNDSVDPCCCQLCFTDTPGVIDEPAYKLQEGMMEAVKGALVDSDVILVVTDLFSTPIPNDVTFHRIAQSDKVKIVVINKVDLVDRVNVGKSGDNDDSSDSGGGGGPQLYHKKGGGTSTRKGDTNDMNSDDGEEEQLYKRTVTVAQAVQNWRDILPDALAIVPLTASNGGDDVGVVALRTLLMGGPDVPAAFRELGRPLTGMFRQGVKFLSNEDARAIIPYGPPLYDSDTLTDRSERFFASEIIRATLFCNLGKELPYCCEVIIDEFREPKPQDKRKMTRILATICVERESQKGIVVGKGGLKVKEVGIEARKQLEEFLQEKVHLKLNVKVDKNWRRDESKLKAYGYLKK